MPKFFLSPSTQQYNLYVNNGNEEYWMNRIADAMEPYLQASGIEFVRNDPDGTVVDSINLSNMARYGMHVALHSNASPEGMEGLLRGVDVYYRPGDSQNALLSQRFANIVVEEMKKIYPLPQRVNARPTNYLAEVLQTYSPAVLIEVAYHDNLQDAEWIQQNVEAIAEPSCRRCAPILASPLPSRSRCGREQSTPVEPTSTSAACPPPPRPLWRSHRTEPSLPSIPRAGTGMPCAIKTRPAMYTPPMLQSANKRTEVPS